MKDYYKILEVEENASHDEIKKSFRNLSKKYHPDVNPGGSEQFKEINEAYETLGDSNKREMYNRKRKNPYSGTQFEDFFSQMFNGQNPQTHFHRPKQAPDKIIKLHVGVLESYRGNQKKVTYFRDIQCNGCMGSGGDQQGCTNCNGLGFHIKTFGTGFMVQQIRQICNTCGGRGYTLIHKCYQCDGRGVKNTSNEITLSLPKGVDNGQFFKLANMGDFRNGDWGDLVVQVEIQNENNFEKINNDLIYNLFLNYEDIKSEKFTIPHPDGELSITSPKMFDTSKPLRVRGKGFFDGDMYVKLFVRFEK
jgi:molecular chaperone DnaJ